jgi:NADP-dependent 3-hydroxy acid dehydrogenase YdfG
MSDFNNILVIGATSGIGRELAVRYHAQGKKIVATGRRAERLAELKERLKGIETYEVSLRLSQFQLNTAAVHLSCKVFY